MITNTNSNEVQFMSGDAVLAGTFLDPGDAQASALILTGSGKLDRNSNGRFRLEVNRSIAEALAAQGVASLRYDKRGAGRSSGDFFEAGMSENYADAAAAVEWLTSRAAGRPIIGIGHSEGALHVAHLAADHKVTAAVLIACPARRGEEILTWQAAQIMPTLPRAAKFIIRLIHLDPLKSQQKAFARIRSSSANSLRIQGKKQNARWLREFMDYDPTQSFKDINCPVLIVVPEHDMQVPPDDAETICALVPEPCKKEIMPGLSHILRNDPGLKGPTAYRKALKEPVASIVPRTISGWIADQLSTRTRKNEEESTRR